MLPERPEPTIQTPAAREIVAELAQAIPGARFSSGGTEIPRELRVFPDDRDAGAGDVTLERGEVLVISDEKGHQVRVLVSHAEGLPGDRVDVLPDSAVDEETQLFVSAVKAALLYKGEAAGAGA
ncbi:MAG: hypothetical protein WCS85_04750 [Candidatus Peribacteraceae bacterium]|jgi:hypothetical protein